MKNIETPDSKFDKWALGKKHRNKDVRFTLCNHTKHPEGYFPYYDWAKKKMLTHKQVKCPVCGLFAIWKLKDELKEERFLALHPSKRGY